MRFFRYLVAIVFLAIFAMINMPTFFQVDTTEYVIVTQFGRPVRAITEPGLSIKLPEPIQSVIRLDKRFQIHDLSQAEFLTRDKKNILVAAYATWQISDPLQFFKSVRDLESAAPRLSDIMASELGSALGQNELSSLVTTDSRHMHLPAMLNQVTEQVNRRTMVYGFQVTDVRLKELNFPRSNRQSVFNRMRAERSRIARQLRSEGSEAGIKIRAAADAERTVILSQARQKAERIRGEAEAEAIRIYAEAYGQDPEFYQFLRTLQAYDKVLTDGTTLILPTDSSLLKYLNQINQPAIQVQQPASLLPLSTPKPTPAPAHLPPSVRGDNSQVPPQSPTVATPTHSPPRDKRP